MLICHSVDTDLPFRSAHCLSFRSAHCLSFRSVAEESALFARVTTVYTIAEKALGCVLYKVRSVVQQFNKLPPQDTIATTQDGPHRSVGRLFF